MFGRILISSLVIFFLASPGGAKDKLRISVAGFDGSSELLLVIGQGAQLFEKHGLKIELIAITGAAPSSSALSRGETDICSRTRERDSDKVERARFYFCRRRPEL